MTWGEFKAAVDAQLEAAGASADLPLRFIDWSHFAPGAKVTIEDDNVLIEEEW